MTIGDPVDVRPARLEWLEALEAGDEVFTSRFGIAVVAGWVGFPESLPSAVEGARARPDDRWGPQLFFDGQDGALVGFGGFKGAPLEGEVELEYAIAPSRQGRGLATSAVSQLAGRARQAGVTTVVAHTLGRENASTAVLSRNGFIRTGETVDDELGTIWRWKLST